MSHSLARAAAAALPLVGLALVVLGCGTGSPSLSPTPAGSTAIASSSAVPSSSADPSPAAPASPSVAAPTPVPTAAGAEPPAASLSGPSLEGAPVGGALGTFTWAQQGSDAPWIVPPTGAAVGADSALSVAFDPPGTPATWIARWARVRGGIAGDLASATEGVAAPTLTAPDEAGTWSLQVEARFGPNQMAVWYWRLDVR